MVKSNGDPDTSEVVLHNSPTKWIQSLQLPASLPKSYSDCVNQQKWAREGGHTPALRGGDETR